MRRFSGPIAVGELIHFFDATHVSINDPARARQLDLASSGRPSKRVKTEEAPPAPAAPAPVAPVQPNQQAQVHTKLKCHSIHSILRQASNWLDCIVAHSVQGAHVVLQKCWYNWHCSYA